MSPNEEPQQSDSTASESVSDSTPTAHIPRPISDHSPASETATESAEQAASASAVETNARDRAGIRRASLTRQYEFESARLASAADSEQKSEMTTGIWKRLSGLVARVSSRADQWVADRRTAWEKQTAKITDVEVHPPVADWSVDAALAQARATDIEAIRFELDGEEYTHWYTWDPENPDHPLNKIVEYYGDGEFSRLFAAETRVDVARHGGVPHLLYPTPFDRWSGHLRYRVLHALRWVGGNPDSRRWVVPSLSGTKVVLNGFGDDHPADIITDDTESTVELGCGVRCVSERMVSLLMWCGIISTCFQLLWAMYYNPDATTASEAFSSVPVLLTSFVIATVGFVVTVIAASRSSEDMETVFLWGVEKPLKILSMIAGWCCWSVKRVVAGCVRRVDSRNPYR